MLLSEAIYGIKNLKGGGRASDDSSLSDVQWIFIINYYRAKLLKQEFTKNPALLEGTDQVLNTVPVSNYEGNMRITDAMPAVIVVSMGQKYSYVGSPNLGYAYQGISEQVMRNMKDSRYISEEGYYYPFGPQQLILKAPDDEPVTAIRVRGIFADPLAVYRFNNTSFDKNYHVEYPMSTYMLDTIYKLITEGETKISSILPPDLVNDSKDTQIEQ